MEGSGAGDETRTRDINLGKVALYQLSYTRARGFLFSFPRLCRQWKVSKKKRCPAMPGTSLIKLEMN
jgi:hypothetical protein